MNKLIIDLESGFIYAYDTDSTKNLFQCCLKERKDGRGYKKEISVIDSGWNDGICGDYNNSIDATEETFFEFISIARKNGIVISE